MIFIHDYSLACVWDCLNRMRVCANLMGCWFWRVWAYTEPFLARGAAHLQE
jgi:hypothetical protein